MARDMCGINSSLCLPSLLNFEAEYRTVPKYNLSTCVVQKSMSTVMTAIFCYLFDEETFINNRRRLVMEWKVVRLCERKNEHMHVETMKQHHPKKNFTLTMVVRDPVDRFLSGFVDKCIRLPLAGEYCNGCKRNMTCFLEKEITRAQNQVALGKFYRTYEDRHFFPQNWRCELHRHLSKYRFIRYSTDPSRSLLTDLIQIFRDHNVPENSINYIKEQLVTERTAHSTFGSTARRYLEKRLLSSPYLLELVVRLFYHDFVIFGFPLPPGFN